MSPRLHSCIAASLLPPVWTITYSVSGAGLGYNCWTSIFLCICSLQPNGVCEHSMFLSLPRPAPPVRTYIPQHLLLSPPCAHLSPPISQSHISFLFPFFAVPFRLSPSLRLYISLCLHYLTHFCLSFTSHHCHLLHPPITPPPSLVSTYHIPGFDPNAPSHVES